VGPGPSELAAVRGGAALQADVEPLTYFPPPEAAGGWRKNTDPEFIRSVGLDPDKLKAFMSYCRSIKYKSGCLVIKNGWIVAEVYPRRLGPSYLYRIHSNSKAVTILLFGHLLLEQATFGLSSVLSLDSNVYTEELLPQGFPLSDPNKALITFRHIFFHVSGIRPEDGNLPWTKDVWGGWTDWNWQPYTFGFDAEYPDSKGLYFTPGTFRRNDAGYSSVAFNHLTWVFQNVTGIPAHQYLRQDLLDAIGVGNVRIKKKDRLWPTAHGLFLTARDYGRVLYLMLRNGSWDGVPVFAPDYLEPWVTSNKAWNIRANKEGYFDVAGVPPFPEDMYQVPGSRVNWGFVVPSLDLIAIRLGDTDNARWTEVQEQFLTKLFEAVLPAQ
jgi:CubicO group peptidase (beta-lactamase class C family)